MIPGSPEHREYLSSEIHRKRQELELREGLPFLFGWPWYQWAWDFFHSKNKVNFLTAANQVSKSSTQIRKCIDWATNKPKWKELWVREPKQFWYMYPSQKVADAEWLTKWSLFLPRGKYKEDPVYGWKEIKEKGHIVAIAFNSGVYVFFKTYSQNEEDLQSGTLDSLFCFVAGTKVETPYGSRNVEEIRVGDRVLSKDGYALVKRVQSREAGVITRNFSDGTCLTGTPEHPFYTLNRGWVLFRDLLPTDTCIKYPQCLKLFLQMLSWFSLMGYYTTGTQNIRTPDAPSISLAQSARLSIPYFGRLTMAGVCQKVLSSTIGMGMRLIIGKKISNVLPDPSTLSTISERSGGSEELTRLFALGAVKGLLHVVLKKWWGIAVVNAGESSLHGETGTRLERVYNLEVSGSHTYFANGVLTHNCDEELPENLYSELNARLTASDGYFHMVFTATLGQEFWRQTMEPRADEEERFPTALKLCVSLYDSQVYMDGSPSHWTDVKIANVKNRCKNHQEYLKRVMGRFVVVGGRKYEAFDATRHMKEKHPVPSSWLIYEGVDVGGGGETAHKAAICFVAVRPDFRAGRVFLGWRGDGVTTTSGDVFQKHLELKKTNKVKPIRQFYDWGNKDFDTISTRAGDPFEKAEKGHDVGEDVINTLFKNDMLFIYEDPELAKLAGELSTLLKSTPKNKAKDDFSDAFRYAVTKVPWDFSYLTGAASDMLEENPEDPMNAKERELHDRRSRFEGSGEEKSDEWNVETEFDEWNSAYSG